MRLLTLLFCLVAATAAAQDYPNRPVKMLVPYGPGGATDIIARIVAAKLTESLGQSFVVENRPGANGNIALEATAKAAPDGYTLLVGNVSTNAINETIYAKQLTIRPSHDLVAITKLVEIPHIVVATAAFPANNIAELIALAKKEPGKINFASVGVGSYPHLDMERFMKASGTQMTHVPYKGIAPAITAQLGNEVQVTFSNVFSTLGHWKAGRLRLIAHGGLKRAESFPDIPTIAESGLPGFESSNWYGYSTTGKTPRAIIRRLNRAFVAAANQPEVRKTLVAQGNEVIANTPEEFDKIIKADARKWGAIGRKLGIKLD